MKIITWNCCGAFRNKYQHLLPYDADIYIIQECENPEEIKKASQNYVKFSSNHLWVGSNKNKGLGVFIKNNQNVKKLSWNNIYRKKELKWFIPFEFNGNKILAVWNHHANAKAFPYIGQFWLYLKRNKKEMKNTIICGDFNSNTIWDSWDRWWNHSDCVRELGKLNLYSVFHKLRNCEQGKEKEFTFYLQKNNNKGYYIDYVFLDDAIFGKSNIELKLGNFNDWKSLSNHVPVILTINN